MVDLSRLTMSYLRLTNYIETNYVVVGQLIITGFIWQCPTDAKIPIYSGAIRFDKKFKRDVIEPLNPFALAAGLWQDCTDSDWVDLFLFKENSEFFVRGNNEVSHKI